MASPLVLDSVLGTLGLVAAEGALTHIRFLEMSPPVVDQVELHDADVLKATRTQLGEYLRGTRRAFDVPPSSSRAVRSANGSNPLPVLVPCHRVIGSNGLLPGMPEGCIAGSGCSV